MKEFYNLTAHGKQPHLFPHQFNPYSDRFYTPALSKAFFDAQNFMDENGVHTTPDFAFMGCLDAPDDIPLGATARISTIGGYEREEYLHLSREYADWNHHMKATAHTSEMLKEILYGIYKRKGDVPEELLK